MNEPEELTPEERKAFEKLAEEEKLPNESLEGRIVKKLIAEGLIGRKKPVYEMSWYMSLAAAIIIFGLGIYVGSVVFQKSPTVNYTHVFLLHQDGNFDEGDGHFEEYGRWMTSLESQGVPIAGEKLGDNAVMTGENQGINDKVTGFFLIKVGSAETALKIAMESPHVKHGGKIEIREIANN